jgi:hypothetical protein
MRLRVLGLLSLRCAAQLLICLCLSVQYCNYNLFQLARYCNFCGLITKSFLCTLLLQPYHSSQFFFFFYNITETKKTWTKCTGTYSRAEQALKLKWHSLC